MANSLLEKLQSDIAEIKARNQRVESDKAWETSLVRRAAIVVLTYLVIVSFFLVIDVERPLINAIVPCLGFVLSTLSLSFLKNIWLKNRK